MIWKTVYSVIFVLIMSAEFKTYLQAKASVNDQELTRIISLAAPKQVIKNELLFHQGEICRYKAFVVTGLLRTFSISEDGDEHIVQFNAENSWAIDAESYDNQKPSRYNLAAVEDTQLLLWSKPDFDTLLTEIPALKTFSEQLISRAVYNGRERLRAALSATPEQRYNDFMRDTPSLMNRVPLRMIAAYLGISIKTLTRIRHAQVQR